jgi:hypothetical protein
MADVDTSGVRRINAEAHKVLDGLCTRPADPRIVEQVIEITTRERLRSTRDGSELDPLC